MDATTVMLGILFGSVGLGFFFFGKKQNRPVHLFAGLALMILPYFIPNVIALGITGAILTIAPFVIP